MDPTMEKTGIPKPLPGDPKPSKEAGDHDAVFPGDNNITERVLQAPQKPQGTSK